jgi:hypothetical protein
MRAVLRRSTPMPDCLFVVDGPRPTPVLPVYSFYAESPSFGLIPCLFVPCWTESGKALCNRSRSPYSWIFLQRSQKLARIGVPTGVHSSRECRYGPMAAARANAFEPDAGMGWDDYSQRRSPAIVRTRHDCAFVPRRTQPSLAGEIFWDYLFFYIFYSRYPGPGRD